MAEAVHMLRSDLTTTDLQTQSVPALTPGSALLRVESFAVTANNVTYAVMGDSFGYWNFFPAPEGWGIVPMLSRTPGGHHRDAPKLGQDTDTVLEKLGLTPEQIRGLKESGVVAGPL